MVVTSTPEPVLFCERMQGDGPPPAQFGSSPSNSPLAELNFDCVPSAVVNCFDEPQQILKCEEPGGWFCCARFLSKFSVIVIDRLVDVKVRTPPRTVHDSFGKPPPVAVSTSLLDVAFAIADPEVPAELTVTVWQVVLPDGH